MGAIQSPVRLYFIAARCLAAGFAFYATTRHAYDFYILTRWIVFLTCCWGVFLCRRSFWPSFAAAYLIIAIGFNPLLPFHFVRTTWQNLDIIAGVVILASLAFPQPFVANIPKSV